MENSIIITCPCCGQALEVVPGNWLFGSVVRLLPRNVTDNMNYFDLQSQNCMLNSQAMSLHDAMLNEH